MLVDVTRCTRHNEKPPTAGKAARGLSVTKRKLGATYGGSCTLTISKAPSPGQGGICHG
jgi:hypothetical protein